jgi:hypothetical protein
MLATRAAAVQNRFHGACMIYCWGATMNADEQRVARTRMTWTLHGYSVSKSSRGQRAPHPEQCSGITAMLLFDQDCMARLLLVRKVCNCISLKPQWMV